jgi:hypothetical protein
MTTDPDRPSPIGEPPVWIDVLVHGMAPPMHEPTQEGAA